VLAVEYYGALSEVLTPDNLKAAVVSVSWREGHIINPSYLAFADHYDLLVLPTGPRKPKEKAAVENTVRLMQRWVLAVLRNRTIYSLAELNAEIRRLVEEFNNRPMKGADKRSRNQVFEEVDLPVMRPLPLERYVYADWKIGVKVAKDYHVGFEGNWYSVPFRLVDERVEICARRDTIEIYQGGRQVATHCRSYDKGQIMTNPDHQTPRHRAFAESGYGEVSGWAETVGEEVVEFVRRHMERATGAATVNAFRSLKQLKRQFGAHRLSLACLRALKMGAISTQTLQSMLVRGLEDKPLSDEATPAPSSASAHEKRAGGGQLSGRRQHRRRRFHRNEGGRVMSSQQTIEQFKSLRLTGMAEAFAHQLGNPAFIDIGFEQRVQMLVEAEWAKRDTQRYERLIKAGKLRVQAAPEDIDYRSSRGLEKAKVADLLTNQWIRHHRNVLLTGATGTGKTWLACAVAVNAARYGISILYQRAAIMLEAMAIAHETGDIEKVRNQYARPQLLILDDFGLVGLIQRHKTDLLELVERRAEGSTIVAGQMPVGKWHEYIGDPAVADAIMDRLVYSSVKIELKGESLRKTRGKPGG